MSAGTPRPSDEIAPQLPGSANVLLLTPALSAADDEACIDLLTVTDPPEEDVLSITVTQSVDDRLELWQSYVGDLPSQAGIISVDEVTRSATVSTDTAGEQPLPTPISIETVTDPGDLTGLGIAISKYLSNWAGSPNRTVVCFHSLTTLLQYADLERVFRFLHLLTGRLKSADAVAHFHLDPGAHDAQTVNTLSQLFDVVVEHDDSDYTIKGAWENSSSTRSPRFATTWFRCRRCFRISSWTPFSSSPTFTPAGFPIPGVSASSPSTTRKPSARSPASSTASSSSAKRTAAAARF